MRRSQEAVEGRSGAGGVSRARFLGAGAAGSLVLLGMRAPVSALASDASPKPIPGGFDGSFNPVPINPFVHVLPPAVGFEMATITDFAGVIAAAEIQGTAVGSDGSSYTFDADMRLMRGTYVSTDGKVRDAAFRFV